MTKKSQMKPSLRLATSGKLPKFSGLLVWMKAALTGELLTIMAIRMMAAYNYEVKCWRIHNFPESLSWVVADQDRSRYDLLDDPLRKSFNRFEFYTETEAKSFLQMIVWMNTARLTFYYWRDIP